MSDLPYTAPRPTIKNKLDDVRTDFPRYITEYFLSLFPIVTWIRRYNLTWLLGDIIAGLTVGAVVIPQGMAYAKVAGLPPEYGLYSSFVGVSIYLFFATSKDITIGPTAVMSLVLGQAIASIGTANYSASEIASAFALISGVFALALGLARLGIIVKLISAPVIAGFCTGSAITISIGQIAPLFGITGIDNKKQAFLVLGRTLGALKRTKIDVVIGVLTLLYLYALKFGTAHLSKKFPRRKRFLFFVNILRNFTAVFIATIISWLINKNKKTPAFAILKTVPSGFNHMGVPTMTSELFSEIADHLPIVTLILLLEHVAIAKSFGRINDYKINPSQEFIAIGVTNVLGSFFGAYPATGSFSRTAIKSASGVRTPLAGIFSGILVVLALYALTPAFYYIPSAGLSAVIVHAVLDLISSPTYVKHIYTIQFWDFFVFVCSVVFTFFFTIEIGIYVSSGLSLLILMLRVARPRIDELGRLVLGKSADGVSPRYVYVPLDHPSFTTTTPPPEGVLIVRLDESLVYTNANNIDDEIVELAKKRTRKFQKYAEKAGDRPWNDAGGKDDAENVKKPRLKALVFDFSAVSVIDSTGVQSLIDIRKELNKYSAHNVEYHFANILDEQIQSALVTAGFDKQSDEDMDDTTGAEIGLTPEPRVDEENQISQTEKSTTTNTTGKRFFHLSLEEAIQAAADGWE
ncbi:2023_t:CDS:2 [Paraglomus brasilianum]|uniref:2023_t:CDS:1 n=1 Tax=Paraglomus brasilianum TaxID=144538 RepID=A0A9N9BPI1_9GLOM|nr:2023_t:CDS:2 [Paraglomus brasilianum]